MPNPTSREEEKTQTGPIRLDDQLGVVTHDGRNSIPWPVHFSMKDWDATKLALESHAADKARIAALTDGVKAAFDHLESLRGRDNSPELWSQLRALLTPNTPHS